MKKDILIAAIAGSVFTAGVLGTLGYFKIAALTTEKARLQITLKKLEWRQENLTESHEALQAEIKQLKAKKADEVDQTIDALMQAKEEASIAALYEIGLKAWQEKDTAQAYFALAQVWKANAHYKEIAKFYPLAEQAHAKTQAAQAQERVKATYAKAYDYQVHRQFAQAKVHYEQVLALQPGYKDTASRLRAVSQQLGLIQRSRDFEQKKHWLEASYALGVKQQNQGLYTQARDSFQAILKDAPRYRDVPQRLKTVLARLPKPPAVVPANTAAQDLNCYEKGAAFGKCASLGAGESNCSAAALTPPPECKGNPEFTRGLKSALGNQGNNSSLSLLRGLPSMLKDL